MNIFPGYGSSRKAPSLALLGARVFLILGIFYLLLISLWLWYSWEESEQANLQRLRVTAALTAGHAQNYFGFTVTIWKSLLSSCVMLMWSASHRLCCRCCRSLRVNLRRWPARLWLCRTAGLQWKRRKHRLESLLRHCPVPLVRRLSAQSGHYRAQCQSSTNL